ncbi:MAG: ASCH domain-containing protein [Actinobacteria bacterium]|nr:ASCH domain-containing protein [Thermoleophilia bacterium]MCB9010217.1 ASCH domain-containing protein [Actinomycetota bacterium]
MFALNFYSPLFVDQLRRGRKTATIRLGNKSHKYRKGQLVWITVGHRHGPKQRIFTAMIDQVDVKPIRELSQRDIERDNPEFRLVEDTMQFLSKIYSREVSIDDTVSVVHFSEVIEFPPLD